MFPNISIKYRLNNVSKKLLGLLLAAGLCLGLLGLTACASESKPQTKPAPTAKTTDDNKPPPGPNWTEEIPTPTAAMQTGEPNEQGAIDAAHYWFSLYRYILATGKEVNDFMNMSDRDCEGCKNLNNNIIKCGTNNNEAAWWRGKQHKLTNKKVITTPTPGIYEVQSKVAEPASVMKCANKNKSKTKGLTWTATFFVKWTAEGWRILEIGNEDK